MFELYKVTVEIVDEGVFDSGDVITGVKTLVETITDAKIVAEAMDKYCRKFKSINGDFPSGMDGKDINPFLGDMSSEIDRELMIKAMDIIRPAKGDITEDIKDILISMGLTVEQISMVSNRENGDSRIPPDNFGEMKQQGEIRNPSNRLDTNIYTGQKVIRNNLIQISLLSLLLIIYLIVVAKYKKGY